jgi:hypothetical protein
MLSLPGVMVIVGASLWIAGFAFGAGCASQGCNSNCFTWSTAILSATSAKDLAPAIAGRTCGSGAGVDLNPASVMPGVVKVYSNCTTTYDCPQDGSQPGTRVGGTLVDTQNRNYDTSCGAPPV